MGRVGAGDGTTIVSLVGTTTLTGTVVRGISFVTGWGLGSTNYVKSAGYWPLALE